jgi:hypothetical protein
MKRGFLADLFCTVDNRFWDLARICSAWAIISVSLLAAFKIYKGMDVSISEYAQAMMTVFTGCALFIGGKDAARTFAIRKSNEGAE